MNRADGPASVAVEPVDEPAAASIPRRRHRWLTAPSGVVVFVCLFLPAVRVCGSPAYPYEAIGVQTPYLLGLLAAILALVPRPRARAALVTAMRLVVWITVGGWGAVLAWELVAEGEPIAFLVWIPIGLILIWMFGLRGHGEAPAVRATLGAAVVAMIWFGLFCFDPGAMYGTYTGAVGSLGLFAGGLWWWREARESRPAISVS